MQKTLEFEQQARPDWDTSVQIQFEMQLKNMDTNRIWQAVKAQWGNTEYMTSQEDQTEP